MLLSNIDKLGYRGIRYSKDPLMTSLFTLSEQKNTRCPGDSRRVRNIHSRREQSRQYLKQNYVMKSYLKAVHNGELGNTNKKAGQATTRRNRAGRPYGSTRAGELR